jgi:hypothetical protein
MNSNDIKTPESNSPDIQFLEKKTQLTEMQKERIKESLEKQEITQQNSKELSLDKTNEPILTKEEIGVKQQEIEQTQKIESYSEELKLYIKNNNFEKLDNNTLSNKIYNEEKLEVELKKKFLIELKHESWLSFIQEINKIKGSNSK